jgi:hypothetical protein
VIGPRLQLRGNTEIRAQKTAAEFGNELLTGAFALVLGVTAEIAADTLRPRCPMRFMPISA